MDSNPPAPPALEPAELRAVLDQLGPELARPLNALRSRFEALLADTSPAPGREERTADLRTMHGLCGEMLDLTRGYLDLAAADRGVRAARPSRHALADLLGELDHRFAPDARDRGIGWTCRLDGDAAPVVDAQLCLELLGQFASNALRFTPAGGRVEVSARVEGTHWSVAVVDDGPGIPGDSIRRVLEPFYRLPRDEQAGRAGPGLGLPIAVALAERLSGELILGPADDGGTRVVVRLPLQAGE